LFYHVSDCYVWGILYRVDLHKVDELVDDSAGDKVERTFPGLGEVVGDQGVDSDAQVVLHEHFLRRLSQHAYMWNYFNNLCNILIVRHFLEAHPCLN